MQKIFENFRRFVNEEEEPRKKKIRQRFSKMVKLSAVIALDYVNKFYLNNYKSFKRLTNSIPKYANEPDKITRQKWDTLSSKIIEQLKITPVKMFHDELERFDDYALKNVQALYDRENKTIYVNAARIRQVAGNRKTRSIIAVALREEYIHRAQHILEELNVPTHSLIWSKAKTLGIILPYEKTNVSKDIYNYYAANPAEFHAKLLHIKLILKKDNPELFDSDDKIVPDTLNKLLKKSGEQYNVLKMINPNKINKLDRLFNMLAANSYERQIT